MADDFAPVMRPRVLTNSAAEFIETRANQALDAELIGPDSPQYVPVRDQFMSKRDMPKVDYHRESTEKMKQLEATLAKLCKVIKDRGFDKKLNIELKDPKAYTMTEVLDIVGKIETNHRDADKVKSCMGRIRKCFRVAENNHGQLKRLVGFVPNDSYGSVISAGFTIILGAVERADHLRNDIYEALAGIPDTLKELSDLAEINRFSAELNRRADAVFVAIFGILERIVDELTRSLGSAGVMTKKGVSLILKGDRYSFDLSEALQDLARLLKEFRTEAETCSQQRLGRVEKTSIRAAIAAENGESMIAEVGNYVADLHQKFLTFQERWESDVDAQAARHQRLESMGQALLDSGRTQEVETLRRESLQTNVYNQIYVLLAASPLFDSRTGTVDRLRLEESQRERSFTPVPRDPASSQLRNNKRLAKSWIEHIEPVHVDVGEDMNECLQCFGILTMPEKDQIQWILTSDEIHDWLRAPRSSMLVLDPQTHPDRTENPMAFSSAFLTKSLKAQDYPTVSFCCGVRANTSMNEDISGPRAMMASLYAQLLREVTKKRPSVDLTALGEPLKSARNLKDARAIGKRMRSLLNLLPDGDCVFIVLDSIAYMTGSEEEADAAVGLIFDLTGTSRIVVKILATEVLSPSVLEGRDHTTLFLPDFVDVGNQDVMPVLFAEDILQSINEGFEAQQTTDDAATDDESGDDRSGGGGWF